MAASSILFPVKNCFVGQKLQSCIHYLYLFALWGVSGETSVQCVFIECNGKAAFIFSNVWKVVLGKCWR